MLFAMVSYLQKGFEKMSAFEIITNLKAVFSPQAWAERYEASELFFSTRMDEHNSVSEHVVKMSDYVQRLNALDCQILDELAIDRVLQPLPLEHARDVKVPYIVVSYAQICGDGDEEGAQHIDGQRDYGLQEVR
jgi:hypothetical protein